MLFYLVIIIVASLFAGGASCLQRKNSFIAKTLYIISALVLFVPLAFRGIGVDYTEYELTYEEISMYDAGRFFAQYNGRPELLYVLLNYIAKWIFGNLMGVNFLCALVSIFFTYAGIWKFREKINLGLTIYTVGFSYYIMMYGLNRMMIAVAVVTWAYQYYLNRRFFKYSFWIVIACLFHYSAIIMIPLYFVMLKMETIGETLKRIGPVKAILGVALIFVAIYVIFPRLFGSMSWFSRYKGYFSLSFTPGALNNNLHLYFCVFMVFLYRKTIPEYLGKAAGLYPMMIMLVLTALGSVIMPIHRICFFMFPCASIMYGAIPGVLRRENKGLAGWNEAAYYGIVMLIGVIWLYYFLVVNENWGPFLVPYSLFNS